MPKYLQKRRRVWYAVLEIPRALRPHFNGKPRLIKSLQTEGQTEAERLVLGVVATWKAIFEAKRNGTAPSDAIAALKAEAEELRLKGWDSYDIKYHQRDVAEYFEDDGLIEAAKALHGESKQFDLYIEDYIAQANGTAKTKDMKAADLRARFKTI